MSSPLPSSSLAALVMGKIALEAKEGASLYFPSCEFSFFEGLMQRECGGERRGGGSRMTEFISVSLFGMQILRTYRSEQGHRTSHTSMLFHIC